MSDLYDTDILEWSERQVALLRRRAAGELVNDAELDWTNIAEEIEGVGRSEVNATLSQIDNILRHRLYLLGWPEAPAVRKWRAELRNFWRQMRRHYTRSMSTGDDPPVTDAAVRAAYADAVEDCLAHMETEPMQPLPAACPWTLEELLSEP